MTDSFSLIDEPWILCLDRSGHTVEVSLLDLFRRADDLREIVGDIPTQGFALLRLALAVLHRSIDGPASPNDWDELWRSGTLPIEQVERHLRAHTDRFDLFHPQAPFFQTSGLHTAKNEWFGLERLIADVPTGHPYFTTRIGGGLDRISAAEAARWLVHAQAFDPSGIKSAPVGDDRAKGGKVYPLGTAWAGNLGGLFIEGESVRETLVLNLVPRGLPDLATFGPDDRAFWESDPPQPGPDPSAADRPFGPVDLYTWPARRILLRGDRDGVTGVVLGYGDPLSAHNRYLVEPMTAWRRSEPLEKKLGKPLVYLPQRHDPARAFWRGLRSVLPALAPRGRTDDKPQFVTAGVVDWLARALDGDRTVALRAVGMEYGTQSAVVADITDDRLVVRAALLGAHGAAAQGAAEAAVKAADDGVLALKNLASNLVRAAGGTDAALTDGARSRAAEQAYASLDQPFRTWLSALGPDTDIDAARADWHQRARRILTRIGADLVEAAGPSAWVGREVSGRRITTPEADGWFRSALTTALPRPSVPTSEDIHE